MHSTAILHYLATQENHFPPERGEVNLQLQQVGNYRVEVRDSRGNLRHEQDVRQLDKVTFDVSIIQPDFA